MMERRRALMGAAKSSARIPAAYQEVEWIGSDKSISLSKIDTGVVFKSKPRVVTTTMASWYSNRSGFHIGTDPNFKLHYLNESSGLRFIYGNTAKSAAAKTVPDAKYNSWHDIDFSQTLKVDGITQKTFSPVDYSNNVTTFKMLDGGTGICGFKFKETQIYDGTTELRDLVPCYRKSDGRIGFYCLVTNAFYTNAGGISDLQKGANVK